VCVCVCVCVCIPSGAVVDTEAILAFTEEDTLLYRLPPPVRMLCVVLFKSCVCLCVCV
jgi:hypothetical protein